jgi:hypothetical protein
MSNESQWASHQPLIKSVMEFYKPKFVLELGVGNFSTPELIKDNEYLGIENDINWINTIKNKFNNLNIVHHDLGREVKIGTKYNELSENQKNEFIKFYENINIPQASPKLLFVDQFTSVRTISLNALGNKFDIIIYHDSEPAGIKWYNYDLLNLNNFKKFHLKSDTVWTTLLIKELDIKIIDLINKNIQSFKNKYKDVSTMYFE